MWRLTFIGCLVLAAACLAAGCAGLKKGKAGRATARSKKGAQQQSQEPVLIGVIEMINPEQNYVLIRCEQAHALPVGADLIAIDPSGTESRLVLTPERKGLRLTADIKEGAPNVLNLVVYQPKSDRGADSLPAAPDPGIPPMEPAPTLPEMATTQPEPFIIDPIPLEPAPPAASRPADPTPTAQ